MSKATISINDVALAAGVSKSTVSQVLNENPYARIKPETQEQIRRVAADLGYRPNRIARSLGRRRTDTIGLMFSGFRNPFFVELAESAERLVQEAGYQAVLDAMPSTGGYGDHGKLREWPVDGILMWAHASQSLSDYLGPQAAQIPVVYMGDMTRSDGSDLVGLDSYDAARQIAEHLIGQGYRKIAQIMPYVFHFAGFNDERPIAYADVCREAGVPLETILLETSEETRAISLAMGMEIARRPASERPRALLCHNDVVAIGVIHGLRRAGLRVPEDIAVTGFDGIEEGQYLDRPLTTARTPIREICHRALDILLRRIEGDTQATPYRDAVSVADVIIGETT